MEIHSENANALERRLDLSVAIADLDKDTDARLKRMGKKAKIDGFRPGKAPLKIIRERYGDQARHEALSEVLDRTFNEVVTAGNLRVAGYPRIEVKEGANASEPSTHLEFSAIFEVYPEIALGEISGVEIERPALEVGETEVDRTIEILCKQRVRYEEVDRAAASEDRVVVAFSGKKDGELFQGGQAENYPFILGRGTMLPEFESAVTGMKAGEEKTFDLSFPEDYMPQELAGKTVQFDLKLKRVSEPVLPAVDADFARMLGIEDGDIEKMRDEITANLMREVKGRIQARLKDQVMDAILKTTPISLPKALVEGEVQRLMNNARQDFENRGLKVKDFPIQPEWFAERARRRIALGLIIAEMVKVHHLYAKPEQVRKLVEEMAETYEHPEEVVRWYYAQPQRLQEVEGVAIEDNVVAWVLDNVKVVDKTVSFNELMDQES
ncbi:MAG: trigger factor [Betaproteobacteria bacterium]|nr:trigger factor [Betaproteobacteria bacterium]